MYDRLVIAKGHGIVFLRSRVHPGEHVGVATSFGVGYLTADELRWLIETGGPAALATLGGEEVGPPEVERLRAEVAQLRAERAAVSDLVKRIYGDEAHAALTSAGLLT